MALSRAKTFARPKETPALQAGYGNPLASVTLALKQGAQVGLPQRQGEKRRNMQELG